MFFQRQGHVRWPTACWTIVSDAWMSKLTRRMFQYVSVCFSWMQWVFSFPFVEVTWLPDLPVRRIVFFFGFLLFASSCCRLHRQVTSEFSATLSKLQDLHDTQAVTRTATRGTWGIESAGKVGSEVGSAQDLLALARFKTSLRRSVARSGREIYGKPMEIAMAILQTIN